MKNILFIIPLYLVIACKGKTSFSKVENNTNLTKEIEALKTNHFNGLGVAIVDSTGISYSKGIGFADAASDKLYTKNTLQPIASVSKTFIGVALMKAQEMQLLNLDDPINKHLPFKVQNPNSPNESITIRHLATHTSSITDTKDYLNRAYILKDEIDSTNITIENIPQSFNSKDNWISLSQFLEHYLSNKGKWYKDDAFSQHKPGTFFEYSNVGASLAAHIIEIVSKTAYSDFISKHILHPLAMTNSGWNYNDINSENLSVLYSSPEVVVPYYSLITYPDGGFITSVNDLAKYLSELIKGYSGNGTLLSKKSYKELFKAQLKDENFIERDLNNPYDDEYNTGVFMGISALGNIGHTGGDPGVASIMFFNTKDRIGRILLVNTNIQNQDGVNAFYGIFDKLNDYSTTLKR